MIKLGEDEKQRLLTEARMLHVAAPALIPMLENRKEILLRKLIGEHRGGGGTANTVAELSVVESMLSEIKAKLQNLTIIKGEKS